MPKKKNEFKDELKRLAAQHGRKMVWIIEQMGFNTKQNFFYYVNNQCFTDEQKEQARSLMIYGKILTKEQIDSIQSIINQRKK